MACTITLTKRTIDHEDAEAAGFTDGYWWTVDCEPHESSELLHNEGGAQTRDIALESAFAVARDQGFSDADITVSE